MDDIGTTVLPELSRDFSDKNRISLLSPSQERPVTIVDGGSAEFSLLDDHIHYPLQYSQGCPIDHQNTGAYEEARRGGEQVSLRFVQEGS